MNSTTRIQRLAVHLAWSRRLLAAGELHGIPIRTACPGGWDLDGRW